MNRNDINPEQMCCVKCGHISPLDEPYESRPGDDGEEWDICPNCGNDNVGGYPCYAMADSWPDDMFEYFEKG